MDTNKAKIGIIGTGIMGMPIAKNLLKNKYDVYAYSRNIKKQALIEKKGIKIIKSLKNFFHDIDILILAVSDTNDVKEILTGKNGLINNISKISIVIDMSTICPIETIKISKKLKKSNISMVDDPVSGGEIGAIKGNLSIMVGGEESIVKKILPIFKVLGEKITHIGASGSGQVAKACNQTIVAQTLQGVSEAFIIADKFKVDIVNLSKETINSYFKSSGIDKDIENIFINLLDECEFARYSPSKNKNIQMDSILKKAKDIIIKVETALKWD